MKNHSKIFAEVFALSLVLLFTYTAFSKLWDWEGTRTSLHNQVFPSWMAEVLLYGLPLMELAAVVLLLSSRFRKWGFMLSVVLMCLFTAYVGLVMTGIFGRIPCSCGGVISSLGWREHFVVNVFFLTLAVWGMGKRE
ncbi:MauE/DoxX family redox-associated membrane protein [Negadavirga shengliensis]|uniref:MauE/DoxX family redox-associated membrane protein n=1 Tax=Negadavirga shengliensis TaxID=1389218 RepID=A0ABV9T8G4_9BACT